MMDPKINIANKKFFTNKLSGRVRVKGAVHDLHNSRVLKGTVPDLGEGMMLKGTGRVDPALMYSM